MSTANAILAGTIMVSAWAIAVFFFRLWGKTRDGLFACFAGAFLLLGIERVGLAIFPSERSAYICVIRLAAFVLILFAIRRQNTSGGATSAG